MKAFLIVVLFVTGCSFSPNYDNNEYGMLVNIQVQVERINSLCNEDYAIKIRYHLKELKFNTRAFEIYTKQKSPFVKVYFDFLTIVHRQR